MILLLDAALLGGITGLPDYESGVILPNFRYGVWDCGSNQDAPTPLPCIEAEFAWLKNYCKAIDPHCFA